MTLELASVPEKATGMVKLQPVVRSTTSLASFETQADSSIVQDRLEMQDPDPLPPHAKQSPSSHSKYCGRPLSVPKEKRKRR